MLYYIIIYYIMLYPNIGLVTPVGAQAPHLNVGWLTKILRSFLLSLHQMLDHDRKIDQSFFRHNPLFIIRNIVILCSCVAQKI